MTLLLLVFLQPLNTINLSLTLRTSEMARLTLLSFQSMSKSYKRPNKLFGRILQKNWLVQQLRWMSSGISTHSSGRSHLKGQPLLSGIINHIVLGCTVFFFYFLPSRNCKIALAIV